MADTIVLGRVFSPGVLSTTKSTTELTSLETNTTASTLTRGTKVLGVMIRPSVISVQRLSTFMATSNDPVVISGTAGNVANVVTQTWTVS